jgi:hypothetical protein
MGSPGINEEDFAFAVMAVGLQWSVYRFVKDGKRGMIAFTHDNPTTEHPEGQWIIGMLEHAKAVEDRNPKKS